MPSAVLMFPPAAGTTLRLDVPHLYLSFLALVVFSFAFMIPLFSLVRG
jgi:hypothetical protein